MSKCRPLTEDEITRIAGQFSGRYRARNLALFMLGLTTGFRIGELLATVIGDVVDRDGNIREVLHISAQRMKGKKKGREVVLGESVRHMLGKWTQVLAGAGFRAGNEYLFCTMAGKKITYYEYWSIVKKAARKAGVSQHGVATHSMRKSFARNVWRDAKTREHSGHDIDAWSVLKDALGHASIQSTQHYMDFLRREDVDPSIIAAQEAVKCLQQIDFSR